MTKRTLTTEAGAPVETNQHSQTAGSAGPTLLQDHHLLEKLARFNRERIPERVVHAVGSEPTGTWKRRVRRFPKWTKQKLFGSVGKQSGFSFASRPIASGGADTARDPHAGLPSEPYRRRQLGSRRQQHPQLLHPRRHQVSGLHPLAEIRSFHESPGARQRLGFLFAFAGGSAPILALWGSRNSSFLSAHGSTASARTPSSG